MILGDSHARNCSVNVQHNLKKSVVVQGLTKPGANIEQIVSPSPKIIANFTQKDTVVIWGGTQDVEKMKQRDSQTKTIYRQPLSYNFHSAWCSP